MYRVLLVEDDRNIQELVVNYFTKKEKDVFRVEVAPDGQTGLEMAYETHYDLLLLDVMLPGQALSAACAVPESQRSH